MTTRIYVEGNTLSQEQRKKGEGLIWHLQVLESSHPDQPGLATTPPEQLLLENSILLLTPVLVWSEQFLKHTQINLDFSCLTLGNFPFLLWKKKGGSHLFPIWNPSDREIFNSSKSHRTATQKFWCFTLRRNPKELSRSLSHQFSSGCQLPADFEEACTHLKDFYMHDSLQQEKHCSSSRERRGHCKLLRFWNPLIKLQLSQNLILTGATSTRCQRKTWFGVGNFGFF